MKRYLIILSVFLFTGTATAQDSPDKRVQIEAMRNLDFMVGNWSGSGWMSFGPTEKFHFYQTEEVSIQTGGTSMLIKGQGRSARDNALVHDALAVIYFDSEKNEYVFNSHLAKGYHGSYRGDYGEGKFVWQIDSPRGSMKYTIRLSEKGQWFEIGERQLQDGSWVQFFEMTLSKK
jgi:hypothetical protein